LQNPTNLESCEHSHPLIRPLATLLAMASAVIPSDASSSLEIGFSLVRERTEKSSSTSDGNVSRNISSMPLSTRYSTDGSRSRGKNGNAVLSIILEDFSDCSMAVHSSRPSSGSGRVEPLTDATVFHWLVTTLSRLWRSAALGQPKDADPPVIIFQRELARDKSGNSSRRRQEHRPVTAYALRTGLRGFLCLSANEHQETRRLPRLRRPSR
jgi:hypothetical protein